MLSTEDEKVWVEPSSLSGHKLSGTDIASWNEQGFCLVDDLLPMSLVDSARRDALSTFPEPGSIEAKAITGS